MKRSTVCVVPGHPSFRPSFLGASLPSGFNPISRGLVFPYTHPSTTLCGWLAVELQLKLFRTKGENQRAANEHLGEALWAQFNSLRSMEKEEELVVHPVLQLQSILATPSAAQTNWPL